MTERNRIDLSHAVYYYTTVKTLNLASNCSNVFNKKNFYINYNIHITKIFNL